MQNADEALEGLRAALDKVAGDDAAELIAQAREQARARVREILTEAFAESMLAAARARLEPPGTPATHPAANRAAAASPRPAQPEGPPAARSRHPSELAVYVYGVVGPDTSPREDLPPGIPRAGDISTIQEGDLAAIVSEVPLDDFGEDGLRAHLSDMDWVERVARAHESVLDELGQRTTVVPMRMCTVYRNEGGVREMLTREADALTAALTHLDGRSEWGVKVFADLARARSGIASATGEADPVSTGTAYLERRRHEREETERVAAMIDQNATEIHESLCALAAEGRVVPSQRPEVTGHRGAMVLNGVYLVDADIEEPFHRRVEELQAEFQRSGLELQTTGPWPAYNFVPGAIGAGW